MNPQYPIKEEFPESSSPFSGKTSFPAPQPMEGLHEVGPPPFLTKTYEMVDDLNSNHIVSWSRAGHSFVIWDPNALANNLLPRHFKHNNFSSFVRQLNTYGFRKIDPQIWEFANEGFLRGQRQLLKNIKRRKTPPQPIPLPQGVEPCVEMGRFELEGEADRLRRDKHVLMIELVKLGQQQQSTRAYLQAMEQRLEATDIKQHQMMNFLARAMQNPAFLKQLVQQKEKRKELEEAFNKKRRRSIKQGPKPKDHLESRESSTRGSCIGMGPVKAEPWEFGSLNGYDHGEVSELEALALEMQGCGRGGKEVGQEEEEEEVLEEFEGPDDKLDEEFWEELLSERPRSPVDDQPHDIDDVSFMANWLGNLSSSPE